MLDFILLYSSDISASHDDMAMAFLGFEVWSCYPARPPQDVA
jgi:hypothetical protein